MKCFDARGNGDGKTVSTLTGDHENRITDYTSIICEPVYCLQGNCIDRADTAGCNGKGVKEDTCYTLNTIDRPAVAYAIGDGQVAGTGLHKITGALHCLHARQAVLIERTEPTAVDVRNLRETGQVFGTLMAKPNGGQSLNYSGAVRIRYIVRRLTPTEYARLQGFPDRWGDIDKKEDFSEEEFRFWTEVRDTHTAINGKKVRSYTKKQMLTWYNKLHTDSAEYKMWGNGIALPTALYVMQGVAAAEGKKIGGRNAV